MIGKGNKHFTCWEVGVLCGIQGVKTYDCELLKMTSSANLVYLTTIPASLNINFPLLKHFSKSRTLRNVWLKLSFYIFQPKIFNDKVLEKYFLEGSPGGLVVKTLPAEAGDTVSIPEVGRSCTYRGAISPVHATIETVLQSLAAAALKPVRPDRVLCITDREKQLSNRGTAQSKINNYIFF